MKYTVVTYLYTSCLGTHPVSTDSRDEAIKTLVARRFNDPRYTHVLFEDGFIVPASEMISWVERQERDAMRTVAACRRFIDSYIPGADEPMKTAEPLQTANTFTEKGVPVDTREQPETVNNWPTPFYAQERNFELRGFGTNEGKTLPVILKRTTENRLVFRPATNKRHEMSFLRRNGMLAGSGHWSRSGWIVNDSDLEKINREFPGVNKA